MFETFDHTADLGLRVRAADLNTLFAEAGEALIAVLVEDPTSIEPREQMELRIEGSDRAYLLFDWLKELLYLFDGEQKLFRRFEVQVADDMLTAKAWGEPLDRARHQLSHEVKAITYHGLKVAQESGEWVAEVIVDI